jgi:hypothetical protein
VRRRGKEEERRRVERDNGTERIRGEGVGKEQWGRRKREARES